jgi:hypothetical protein
MKFAGLTIAAGILAPVSVLAAPDNGPDVMYVVTNGDAAEIDVKTKDLDAELADARARLEDVDLSVWAAARRVRCTAR